MDARTVRPYIPTSAVLMHKMADEVSYSNACWDARLVRPLAKPRIYACILNGTDARTVRPYIPLARKSSCHSANPKVQCSIFKVQRHLTLKFNIQNSMFKGKVPTLLSLPYYAIIAALRLFKVGLGTGQKISLQSRKTTGKHPMWALTDSNRRPSACKADALNQLS